MPKKCTVKGCRSGYETLKNNSVVEQKNVTVFSFPKDSDDCQAWAEALVNGTGCKPHKKITKSMGICELHWPTDVTRVRHGRYWVPGVPPSLFCPVKSLIPKSQEVEEELLLIPGRAEIDRKKKKKDKSYVFSPSHQEPDDQPSHSLSIPDLSSPNDEQEVENQLAENDMNRKRNKRRKGPKQGCHEVVWTSWKEQYLLVSSKLERAQEFAKTVDLNFLELSMDVENFPEARSELDNVQLLMDSVVTDAVVNKQQKSAGSKFSFQDYPSKLKYLDEEIYDLFSILSDEELEDAFQWFMETEIAQSFSSFPKLLLRLKAVKENFNQRKKAFQSNLAREDRCKSRLNETQSRRQEIHTENTNTISAWAQDTNINMKPETSRFATNANSVPPPPQKMPVFHGSTPALVSSYNQDDHEMSSIGFSGGAAMTDCEDTTRPVGTTKDVNLFASEADVSLQVQTEKDLDEYLKRTLVASSVPKGKCRVTCPICKKDILRYILKRHVRSVHWKQLQPYLCTICGQLFSSRTNLNMHIRVHDPVRAKLECDICGSTFINIRNFRAHKKNHFKSKTHSCPVCQKMFVSAWEMRQHCKKIHQQKEKTHFCGPCSKSFSSKYTLLKHNSFFHSSDSQSGVYKCPLCTFTYIHRHLMASHMLTHPDLLAHCVLCDRSFESTSDLHAHVTSIHLEEKDFRCETCGECFFTSFQLYEHKRSHKKSPESFPCFICGKVFSSKRVFEMHKQTTHGAPQYKCEICQKDLRHKGSYNRHLRIHAGNKPHKCTLCDKNFTERKTLAVHMWTHMSQKRFKCDQCDAGYNDKRALISHVRRTHLSSNPEQIWFQY